MFVNHHWLLLWSLKSWISYSNKNEACSGPFIFEKGGFYFSVNLNILRMILVLQLQVSNFHHDGHDERPSLYSFQRDQVASQKAMSLPSSPHDYRSQASERSELSRYGVNDETESTWNKVLESQMYNDKPLLPYEGWNIDFSELTVGTRVGIGKF